MHAKVHRFHSRQDWLDFRRHSIGASDAPAVLGVCPYRTALHVWLDKTRDRPVREEPLPVTDPRTLGQVLEPAVAELYARRTGNQVAERGWAVYSHPTAPHLTCSPDRLVYRADNGESFPLELKTSASWDGWGPDGSDFVPLHYAVQVRQQLHVLGLPYAELAVLIGGCDLRIYRFTARPETQTRLSDRLTQFWREHVIARVMPEPNCTHEATLDVWNTLVPPTTNSTLSLTGEKATYWADQYQRANRIIGEAEADRAEAKMHLILMMGTFQKAVLADGRRLTRKESVVREHTVKEHKQVAFRMLPARFGQVQQHSAEEAGEGVVG